MSARRENLNSIYVLLFLEIAFFVIQLQDPERYGSFFAFERSRVLQGEIWRLFTFQFVHSGLLSLFFGLLILYVMGTHHSSREGYHSSREGYHSSREGHPPRQGYPSFVEGRPPSTTRIPIFYDKDAHPPRLKRGP